MRMLPALLSAGPILLMLAGCAKDAPDPSESAAAIPDAASAAASAAAMSEPTAAPATARTVKEDTGLYLFDYAYPAQAAAIPGLRQVLDDDLADQRSRLANDAREGRAAAKEGGFDYRPYATGVEWQVVAETPGWLSLSAKVYSDTGGAHPNHGYDALLWDKAAGQQRAVLDLFVSKQAFTQALSARFCDLLDRERARRRGQPVDRSSGDDFDACIDPADQTVILGSSNGQVFDRIGVLVGPYAAGPYAEGDYEVTLPVTRAILAAVKPDYRSAFATGR